MATYIIIYTLTLTCGQLFAPWTAKEEREGLKTLNRKKKKHELVDPAYTIHCTVTTDVYKKTDKSKNKKCLKKKREDKKYVYICVIIFIFPTPNRNESKSVNPFRPWWQKGNGQSFARPRHMMRRYRYLQAEGHDDLAAHNTAPYTAKVEDDGAFLQDTFPHMCASSRVWKIKRSKSCTIIIQYIILFVFNRNDGRLDWIWGDWGDWGRGNLIWSKVAGYFEGHFCNERFLKFSQII